MNTLDPIIGVQRLINSVWTLRGVETSDGYVITYYGRDDGEGYDREHELPAAKLMEAADRHAIAVEFFESASWDAQRTKAVRVVNRRHVFDYGA